mgnify:CR=1 FL=1
MLLLQKLKKINEPIYFWNFSTQNSKCHAHRFLRCRFSLAKGNHLTVVTWDDARNSSRSGNASSESIFIGGDRNCCSWNWTGSDWLFLGDLSRNVVSSLGHQASLCYCYQVRQEEAFFCIVNDFSFAFWVQLLREENALERLVAIKYWFVNLIVWPKENL